MIQNEHQLNFPVHFYDSQTKKHYQFEELNSMLYFDLSGVHRSSTPYYMNTKKEFVGFLKQFQKKSSITLISREKFEHSLMCAVDHMLRNVELSYDFYPDEKVLELKERFKKEGI